MNVLLLLARLLLSALFMVSGVSKLGDRDGVREAAEGFGVPPRWTGLVSRVLPVLELVIAVLLLPAATATVGAVAATGLMVAFTAVVANQVLRGNQLDCHCFGKIGSSEVGPKKLVQNVLLTACAALVAVLGPGLSPVAWAATAEPLAVLAASLGVALAALIAAAAWGIVSMLRQQGRLLMRIESIESALTARGFALPQPGTAEGAGPQPDPGLPVGSEAPSFDLGTAEGVRTTLVGLLEGGHAVLLFFSDPSCGVCAQMMPEVAQWGPAYAEEIGVVVVSRGDRAKRVPSKYGSDAGNVPAGSLLDSDGAVSESYRITMTPTAVAVAPDGTIAAQAAVGPEAIRWLLARMLGGPAAEQPEAHRHNQAHERARRLAVGEPSPEIDMQDTDREPVTVADPDGRPTVLLFWDPGCRFCRQILVSLRAWLRSPSSPRFLVISRSPLPANERLDGAVEVIDADRSMMRAFGIEGTPAAILLDAEGIVAEAASVGAPQVLELVEHATLCDPAEPSLRPSLEPAME
jgi:peroxiredoxin/uncharacterized membrane protein YphA (DoxX/SURF4 family)